MFLCFAVFGILAAALLLVRPAGTTRPALETVNKDHSQESQHEHDQHHVRPPTLGVEAIERDTRKLLGEVMGFVAVTVGFAALGAYLGRDLTGAIGLVLFIGTIPLVFGLNIAAAKGREELAIGLLFGLGLVLGLAVAPIIADYAKADPSALWQAAGATAAFVAATGAYGYATRRDLSSWGRTLFWALLGLIGFGIVAIFVSIPNSHVIYSVAGLAIFGAFTIFDFNRLRRASVESAGVIAASIFLGIFNVYVLLLDLFGGEA